MPGSKHWRPPFAPTAESARSEAAGGCGRGVEGVVVHGAEVARLQQCVIGRARRVAPARATPVAQSFPRVSARVSAGVECGSKTPRRRSAAAAHRCKGCGGSRLQNGDGERWPWRGNPAWRERWRSPMGKIEIKLADLTRRISDLEAQIALYGEGHSRDGDGQAHATGVAIAAMQKRLSSLRRSCRILARHA